MALARALVIEPDLLLLDEPLSNLDAGLRGELRDEIRALQKRLGITAVFVSHDQAEALAISDRVLVMRAGRVVEAATPAALTDHPIDRFTAEFLGARTVLAGRIEGGGFVTEAGFAVAAPADLDANTSHIVLRAARLGVDLPVSPADRFRVAGTVQSVSYLGDVQEARIYVGGATLRVIRPTTLPVLAVGQAVSVAADERAISWLSPRSNAPLQTSGAI